MKISWVFVLAALILLRNETRAVTVLLEIRLRLIRKIIRQFLKKKNYNIFCWNTTVPMHIKNKFILIQMARKIKI